MRKKKMDADKPGRLTHQRDTLRRRAAHLEELVQQKDRDRASALELADDRLRMLVNAEKREAGLLESVKALKTLLRNGVTFGDYGSTVQAFAFDEGAREWRKA